MSDDSVKPLRVYGSEISYFTGSSKATCATRGSRISASR